ncbi:MAG: tetrathionate reductase family octaheme c-type cytochrome [Melioribacteraceae bacterium]|nr:tetrathionate reductase family octaheme c-type cytochrome [Melioribacteraceae bacterium]MCF8353373.1 tetrathionate reductase family octaheme c-type cytochrome [Melioribacteraceae bacterium]MCF8393048.1 tetrathionate reductase family octaheme c-type cytochrome [Melioribacteraceae bacterium]MCF8419099.1 tetrathionate reductase family octaheme c-type cytochrome [Melioribacteraceae bacterium]
MFKDLFLLFFLIGSFNFIIAQDHSELIEGPFETPQEVTETCLMCHDGVGEEVLDSRHWNWIGEEFEMEDGRLLALGKKNIINNFCIAVSSNEPRCTSCHIGYGWKDDSFDFSDPANIDCLVCHEQTGEYVKVPTAAGMPGEDVDLVAAAQSVATPGRANCGTCHFDGGGGTGVKHGDMDDSLYDPDMEVDIHMGGFDFSCTECHVTTEHKIAGAGHASMAEDTNHISCIDCHDSVPHEKSILNNHTEHVACETCHIPYVAKVIPTKTWWDWSKAGMDREAELDSLGLATYSKMKGEFKWQKNLQPEYTWHNGKMDIYVIGDKVKSNEIVKLNNPKGNISESDSKISPFKIMRGKQIYDDENNYLIVPNLFGKDGYWKTYNWNKASEIGMASINLEYSGSYDFIETEMYWPLNHMVAPADQSLKCTSCHGVRGENLLDWKALGYKGDPLSKGGRVKNKLIKK